jgi:hypothetical protein
MVCRVKKNSCRVLTLRSEGFSAWQKSRFFRVFQDFCLPGFAGNFVLAPTASKEKIAIRALRKIQNDWLM